MFFAWYANNRHFKKGNISGQIIPFLLVILVILLSAALATIRIGNVAVRKTCSANSADAGSLAAASVLAAALNNLKLTNLEFERNFRNNYAYVAVAAEEATRALNDAKGYIDQARTSYLWTIASMGAAIASSILCLDPLGWIGYVAYGANVGVTAWKLKQASDALGAVTFHLLRMKTAMDNLKTNQWQLYCSIREVMDELFAQANEVGLQFAENNNCGLGGASASLSIPSIVSYKVWHTDKNYPKGLKVDVPAAIGNFVGGLLDALFDKIHDAVNAFKNLDIPGGVIGKAAILTALTILFPPLAAVILFGSVMAWLIDKYVGPLVSRDAISNSIQDLMRDYMPSIYTALVIRDDPFGIQITDLYHTIISDLYGWNIGNGIAAGVLYAGSVAATVECYSIVAAPAGLITSLVLYGVAIGIFISHLLSSIVFFTLTDWPIDDLSVDRIKQHVDEIMDVLYDGNAASSYTYTSVSCDDVAEVADENLGEDPMSRGLVIVALEDITLSGWSVNANASVGGSSSSSTSEFSGGRISIIHGSEEKYYPRITAAN